MTKKVLLLPFLRMSSGHHQVADSLATMIREMFPDVECKKMDVFSYRFGFFEQWASKAYLFWIRYLPQIYHWLYAKSVHKPMTAPVTSAVPSFPLYEKLLLSSLQQLIIEEKADLIICTHALPSYLMSVLKQKYRYFDTPVINAYTDFYVNALWGTVGIDFHFAPDEIAKNVLISRGIAQEKIFVTGIPVHPSFKQEARLRDALNPPYQYPYEQNRKQPFTVMITGGNLGVGRLQSLIDQLEFSGQVRYWVFCGQNKPLYDRILQVNNRWCQAFPYISDMELMSAYYDYADAVITKPGGVTLSECIRKDRPVFIYDTLPGQEMYNLEHLKKQQLVEDIVQPFRNGTMNIEHLLIERLSSADVMDHWRQRIKNYACTLNDRLLEQPIIRTIR